MSAAGFVAAAGRLLGEDAVRPSPDEARRWAQEELSKPAYQKSFLERFLDWLSDLLQQLFGPTPGGGQGAVPLWVAVVVGVVVLAAVLAVVVRIRRTRKADPEREPDGVLGPTPLTAQDYRRRAAAAHADGDARGAVLDGFRALAAAAVERGLLAVAPDRTAGEFAAAIGSAFTPLRGRVEAAGRVFDAVLYGDLTPTLAQGTELLDLDRALSAASPVGGSVTEDAPPLAVPR